MVVDNHLIDEKIPMSVIGLIAYMVAGMIAYKAFNLLTNLHHQHFAVQIDILTWRAYHFDITKKIQS